MTTHTPREAAPAALPTAIPAMAPLDKLWPTSWAAEAALGFVIDESTDGD